MHIHTVQLLLTDLLLESFQRQSKQLNDMVHVKSAQHLLEVISSLI